MVHKMIRRFSTEAFRNTFQNIDKDVVRWFPGHMGRSLKQMQNKLKSIDCIIEVHDARIPLSGRNSDFKHTVSGIKPHILVLNKVDLIESKFVDKIRDYLSLQYEHIIFTNCKDRNCIGVRRIFPLAQELINKSNRYNRSNETDYNIMIIGVPNVGKSSLVNALRIKYLKKGKATPVGAAPGITKSVLNKIKMCENPLFYMLDTPGILTPKIDDVESGLKLALCATIQDHLVGEKIITDYLLYWLNKNQHFEYVQYFELDNPTDNILELLTHISKMHGKTIKVRNHLNQYIVKPDLDNAAKIMLKSFRTGSLGKIVLDKNLLHL